MSVAALSIGSNLGDRYANLMSVVDGLGGVGGAVRAASPIYETAAWGPIEQDDYLNAVLVVGAEGVDAHGWLDWAHRLERAAGRQREVRWGPRTLDVDVLTVLRDDGSTCESDDPELTLPHPRAHERAFVLVPWADVDSAAVLPGHGTVAELAAALPEAERAGVRRRNDLALAVSVP
jgi:2-amino-4-hydroxy-6-hydroxymethyldihydropteridine diphosphokinase